jgi:hypothetical protein
MGRHRRRRLTHPASSPAHNDARVRVATSRYVVVVALVAACKTADRRSAAGADVAPVPLAPPTPWPTFVGPMEGLPPPGWRGDGPRGKAQIGSVEALEGTVSNAERVVAGMKAGFRACYNRGLAENPTIKGALRLPAWRSR